jgi:hypothetical protein
MRQNKSKNQPNTTPATGVALRVFAHPVIPSIAGAGRARIKAGFDNGLRRGPAIQAYQLICPPPHFQPQTANVICEASAPTKVPNSPHYGFPPVPQSVPTFSPPLN